MKLESVLRGICIEGLSGELSVDVSDVQIDSRSVGPGCLFIAVRGTQTDGHKYIPAAVEAGAAAVLCEEIPADVRPGVAYAKVLSTEEAAGPVATAFYGNPSSKLKLVGVTGTNGKTTVATQLYNLFGRLGHKCGLLSTVCNYIGGTPVPADHTTPDPISLNRLLAAMVEEGCEYAFMECSSHAIAQKRIGGLEFAGGIFTNLTRDHLDYHKTFENYRDAKKAFFDALGSGAFAITNIDDRNGLFMVQNTKARVKTYSTRSLADFKALVLDCHFEGMYMDINGKEVGVNFIGKFNASNLLAVYGAAVELGKEPEETLVAMSTLHSVSGRLEPIASPLGYTAVVDYAHTPDALENVISAIREVMNGQGKLTTVCGAGGNRDKGKRPLMARIAAQMSDRVFITSDNPRFEEPRDIIADMLEGLDDGLRKKVFCVEDRREAIRLACSSAGKRDVVLVAGKGHEDYQEIRGVKHHFDDREVVRELVANEKP